MGIQVKVILLGTAMVAVALTTIIALILALANRQTLDQPYLTQFGIVFDAGSSHTALFLYQWKGNKENNTGIVSQKQSCDVDGDGISSYVQNASGAGESLKKCLDVAKAQIPKEQQKTTPVYLGATAGMRLLSLQNQTQADSILAEVTKTIQSYPFDFRGARILTGMEEGAYGWITTNYLLESFIKHTFEGNWIHPKAGKIIGALDLGGASTQISFTPKDPVKDPNSAFNLQLYGYNYELYTNSYLCYGKDQALKKLQARLYEAPYDALTDVVTILCSSTCRHAIVIGINRITAEPTLLKAVYVPPAILSSLSNSNQTSCQTDLAGGGTFIASLIETAGSSSVISHPCYHKGYTLNLTLAELYNSPCVVQPSSFNPKATILFSGTGNSSLCLSLIENIVNLTGCALTPDCGFNGIYQPPVNGEYFAFSAYFYTFDFLGLTPKAPLTKVLSTIETLCSKNWTTVTAENPAIKPKYLKDYCASAHYIMTILLKGYKFNTTWDQISFVKQVAETDIGWTLGYMLNLTNMIPSERSMAVTGVPHSQWAAEIFFIVFALFLSLLIIIILFVRDPK